MIDIQTEQVLPITEVPNRLPRRRRGAKANISTIWRWCNRGCKGVILESLMVGGQRCTSLEHGPGRLQVAKGKYR